jgi:sugar lactone lactonase YvrE
MNARVLKFPPNSDPFTNGTIVAGTGKAGSGFDELDTPQGIYVDEYDNDTLYVVDRANSRVMQWLVNSTNGTIVAGGNGAGANYTQLNYPRSVSVDSFGTVYVSDAYNNRIMKWLKGADNGTLVVGTGIGGNASWDLNQPTGFRFDTNGNLYVSDMMNNRVQRFTINNATCY